MKRPHHSGGAAAFAAAVLLGIAAMSGGVLADQPPVFASEEESFKKAGVPSDAAAQQPQPSQPAAKTRLSDPAAKPPTIKDKYKPKEINATAGGRSGSGGGGSQNTGTGGGQPATTPAPKSGPYCKDNHIVVAANGSTTECHPYKCQGPSVCRSSCTNINHCSDPVNDACVNSMCVPRTNGPCEECAE